MKSFLSALSFLTPVRVPQRWCGGEQGLRGAPLWFPAVGALIGAAVAAIGYGLDQILPSVPASTITVLLLVAASAGLHLDGLADTADGLFSARPREQVLEIMRDSRIGTMGVLAVVGVLLLKTGLFTAVDESLRWRTVLLVPVAGRCAVLLVMSLFPYARPEGGLATVFRSGGRRAALLSVWAVIFVFAAGWLCASYRGVAAAGASIATALLFGWYVRRRVGGYTGDTLGATSELTEVIPFLVVAVWAL
jgi:adenosylcobinamide-GDP ribazoletransferase